MKCQSEILFLVSLWDKFTSGKVEFCSLRAHDAAEFLQPLLDAMEGTIAAEFFIGNFGVVRACNVCGKKAKLDQPVYALSVPLCPLVYSI